MQVQLDIASEQLLKIIKKLPADQLLKLKAEIEREGKMTKHNVSLEKLLLKGPVASKKQLQVIAKNRITINQWQK